MAVLATSVISHWYNLIEGFQTPPMEFYAAIERAIEKRQVPDSVRSRVDWREAGVLSAKRAYLRVDRREHRFDVCGAPFGTGFFVSWWLTVPPPSILVRLILLGVCLVAWVVLSSILFAGVGGVLRALGLELLALMLGFIVAFVGGITGLFLALHLAVEQGSLREDVVEAIPGIGWVYHYLISPLTYYRIDTALMFQETIRAAVNEAIDEVTRGKGVRALTELEQKPILREFARK